MGFSCRLVMARALLLLILAALASASSMAAKKQGRQPRGCGGHTSTSPTPELELPPCSGHRGQAPAPVLGLLGRRGSPGAPPPPRSHPPSQTVLGYDEAVRAHRRSCHPGCSVHHHLKRAIAGRRGGGEGGEGAAVAEAGAAHKAALPGATTTSGEVSSTNVFVSAATTSGEVRTGNEFAASRRRSRFNQRLRATMNP
uniref:Uncharacterized protein n=1 Tax=Oryza glumipatula TaxID=40148 RepID=A0A0E0BCK3_9ORYZ